VVRNFIFLDLEDAVAPDDKLRARKNIIEAINDMDWKGHGVTISVRINAWIPNTWFATVC